MPTAMSAFAIFTLININNVKRRRASMVSLFQSSYCLWRHYPYVAALTEFPYPGSVFYVEKERLKLPGMKRGKRHQWLVILLFFLFLTACAAPMKIMIDEQGRQATCNAAGTGILGATAAITAVELCAKKYKEQGYIELGEFEKTEPPKIEEREGISPPKAGPPALEVGYRWTYQLSGRAKSMYSRKIVGTETVAGALAFVIEEEDRQVLLNEELNPIQIREKGVVTTTHKPFYLHYAWPLEVGKVHRAGTESQTPLMGKIKTLRQVEVKGYGIVRVPAGEFEAFYLLVTAPEPVIASMYKWWPRVLEIWYAPSVCHYVKLVVYTEKGRLISELTDYSLTGEDYLHK
jgi:hypothetical protein